MGRAEAALELLMTGDPEWAEELAQELCALNRERQTVEGEIFQQCVQRLGEAPQAEALVLAGRAWHQGVVGIVASRLAEKYARPCFMICLDQGMGKGSCRSWGGINLFELLEECAPLLESFGGHALAAGFTVREERIPALAQALAQAVAERAQGTELPSVLEADGVVPPELLTVEEVSALDRLEPPAVETRTIRDTVSSLRLDAVAASGFSLSRGKAADLIASGRVQLNHRECVKPDHAVAQGDVLSCRGLGKCVLTEVGGPSKKGRILIVLERYV